MTPTLLERQSFNFAPGINGPGACAWIKRSGLYSNVHARTSYNIIIMKHVISQSVNCTESTRTGWVDLSMDTRWGRVSNVPEGVMKPDEGGLVASSTNIRGFASSIIIVIVAIPNGLTNKFSLRLISSLLSIIHRVSSIPLHYIIKNY